MMYKIKLYLFISLFFCVGNLAALGGREGRIAYIHNYGGKPACEVLIIAAEVERGKVQFVTGCEAQLHYYAAGEQDWFDWMYLSFDAPDYGNYASNEADFPGLYPEASTRYIDIGDLMDLDSWQLRVMRNEIFARHGYIFRTKEMRRYFKQQAWYRLSFRNVSSRLSKIELANIRLIKEYER